MASLDGIIDHHHHLIWASGQLKKHLPTQGDARIRVDLPDQFNAGQMVMLRFHGPELSRELLVSLTPIPGTRQVGCSITQLPERRNRPTWQQQHRLLALQEAAYRDPLTGLLNRRAFEEHLDLHMHNPESFALIIIDLDGLKAINDLRGHEAGDQFLQAFAGVLQEQLRTTDTPFRIGGDEFAVIMQDLNASHRHIVDRRMEGVREVVRRRMYPECDFSTGVSFFPEESVQDARALQQLADGRMYDHKNSKRSHTHMQSQLVRAIQRRAVHLSQQATLELLGSGQKPGPEYWQLMLEYAVQMVPSAQAGSLNLWDGSRFVRVAQSGFEPEVLGAGFTREAMQVWYGPSEGEWRSGEPRIMRGSTVIFRRGQEAASLISLPAKVYETAGRIREILCNITAPICHDGQVYGHLNLDNFVSEVAFNEESRLATVDIVRQCATVCHLLKLEGLSLTPA